MKTTNGRSSTSNRVLIVDNQGIMAAGLKTLISGDVTLEVLRDAKADEQNLVQEIQRIKPDTIILILESQEINPGHLLDLLADFSRLRIIQISTDSNAIDVFDREHVITQSQESLISKLRLE
jgi:DNA-binding NarL/FixJ family response regulator